MNLFFDNANTGYAEVTPSSPRFLQRAYSDILFLVDPYAHCAEPGSYHLVPMASILPQSRGLPARMC